MDVKYVTFGFFTPDVEESLLFIILHIYTHTPIYSGDMSMHVWVGEYVKLHLAI